MRSIRNPARAAAGMITMRLGSVALSVLYLTMPIAQSAQALTPQELFEKIIPKVKQPVRHRAAARPRVARPDPAKNEIASDHKAAAQTSTQSIPGTLPKAKPEAVADALPADQSVPVPLPRPKPKIAELAAPPAIPSGQSSAELPTVPNSPPVSSLPTVTKVPTVSLAPSAWPRSNVIPMADGKSKKADRLIVATDGSGAKDDRIERAKQATAIMAGATPPSIDFQELAFAPPVLATPLTASQAALPVPVVPVAPTLASAVSGFPTGLVPIPRRKPDVLPASLSTPIRPAIPESLAACRTSMSGLKISAVSLPPVQSGSCGAPDPYNLQALDDGAVTLSPAAKTNCEMATQLAHWLDDKVQPAALAKLGGRVTGLRVADSYSCRSRDGIPGAQLSEHAFMNAVDIGAFQVNGKWLEVEKKPGRTDSEQAFLDQARAGACDDFMTVLGPGSDSYHSTHFHLDMRHRGKHGDSRYCH